MSKRRPTPFLDRVSPVGGAVPVPRIPQYQYVDGSGKPPVVMMASTMAVPASVGVAKAIILATGPKDVRSAIGFLLDQKVLDRDKYAPLLSSAETPHPTVVELMRERDDVILTAYLLLLRVRQGKLTEATKTWSVEKELKRITEHKLIRDLKHPVKIPIADVNTLVEVGPNASGKIWTQGIDTANEDGVEIDNPLGGMVTELCSPGLEVALENASSVKFRWSGSHGLADHEAARYKALCAIKGGDNLSRMGKSYDTVVARVQKDGGKAPESPKVDGTDE